MYVKLAHKQACKDTPEKTQDKEIAVTTLNFQSS